MFLWPNFAHRPARRVSTSRGFGGYTLVEILVALTLTLILMTTVVTVFGRVGTSMRNARRALEQFDRLRTAAQQLSTDFNGITARLDGRPGRPEEALGYFELIEGSYLSVNPANPPNAMYPYYGVNDKGAPDYTAGERGDILLFTARNPARPFVGRFGKDASGNPQTIQSDVAEIAWYLRGNRLHRRVLLIVPGVAQALASYSAANTKNNTVPSFYNDCDISARLVHKAMGANSRPQPIVVPNSLADLVKRENRFGHDATQFPFEVRQWGPYGLPTLAECTSPTWMQSWTTGSTPPAPPPSKWPPTTVDVWDNSTSSPFSLTTSTSANLSDQALALTSGTTDGQRVADDVVLTNVLSFDVKVWEPAANGGAGGYVDLGSRETGVQDPVVSIAPGARSPYQPPTSPSMYRFSNGGISESGLSGSGRRPRIYDSGCFSYANELGNSQATNGLDDFESGVVDGLSEYIVRTSPTKSLVGMAPGVSPYPVPLRGIQVTIRCFEPDSKQIREITIEHDFLPK